ncbi:MAG: sugar kinase [Candidatus Tectomicrobia bacterium]|nr:sugar kinase [Candidatus Tectomicrobia bacterium]
MSLLVVGSVALDSVRTPFGEVEEVLGGSATYFSTVASYFCQVQVVAVVGDDFPHEHLEFLRSRDIHLEGLSAVRGKTFRWRGEYGYDLNEAHTLETRLNVFETFEPVLPESYRKATYVFLANIDPELQSRVLDQVISPTMVACDTMNFWIAGKYDALRATLKRVDLLVINEAEARELAREPNIIRACRIVLTWGPKIVIVKRGEYGAIMVTVESIFSIPGYPLETIADPTGAGDCFAGGLMGYLANVNDWSEPALRQGIIFGSAMASFNVERFSLEGLRKLTYEQILERYEAFRRLVHFESVPSLG